ncbi:hypothetical protein GCM10009759_17490 [Kitasatospora saccharophila]|uniref:Uncharacterized protein n=1 Tax=Kitasatospora saccharophila TaxID=407973 RepID=A0ABN2WGV4_9ACTN
MSVTADLRLWQIVEDAAAHVTDEAGRFRRSDLEAELRERLADEDLDVHVRSAAVGKLAGSLVRGFGERRSPKPRRRASMFHPQGILKLGGGVWVWMEHATPTDLLEWGRLSTRNLAKVAVAEADRQDYVAERLDAFRLHSGLTHLGELERAVYGYTGPDPAGFGGGGQEP